MKTSRFALLSKILILLALIASTAAPPTAAAQPELTFNVNAITDVVDALPGDGICETATGNGMCTLRAAVMEANARIGGDTIQLPAGTYHLTIVGAGEDSAATGDLDVTDSLRISGAGNVTTSVDADGLGDRVFDVKSSALRLTLSSLKIRNGSATGSGGGILAQAELSLTDVVLQSNSATLNGGGITSSFPLNMTGGAFYSNTSGGNGGGIYSGHALELEQVTFSQNSTSGYGGSIYLAATANASITGSLLQSGTAENYGGHIFNAGTLEIQNSAIDGGEASLSGGGIGNGSDALLSLTNVGFTSNSSVGGGGAIANFLSATALGDHLTFDSNSSFIGGAIENAGELQLSKTIFTDNFAVIGGAISNSGDGVLNLKETTLFRNIAEFSGGGIWTAGLVNLDGVTISQNQAGTNGGGIMVEGQYLDIENSTISGNTAEEGGGGIYNFGTLNIANSTITANIARLSGVGDGDGGGICDIGATSIQNTIIYGNSIKFQMIFLDNDCSGTLTTRHYNLIGTLDSCTLEESEGLDLIDVDPLLGTLHDNGGPTDTHALLDGSPAIDAANPDGCDNLNGIPLQIDQRNLPRHWDGDGDGEYRCDIGAFEYPVTLDNLYLPVIRR